MAAGKNYVSALFEARGFFCIDADRLVHEVVRSAEGTILSAFRDDAQKEGITLTNEDGSLNRRALGALIFPHPELLARQEAIVYPLVIQKTRELIAQNPGKHIILNATVLYKTPELLALCSKILFVTAPCLTRLKRALKRDKMPLSHILARFRAQRPLLAEYKKTGIPLLVIKNSGNKKRVEQAIEAEIESTPPRE